MVIDPMKDAIDIPLDKLKPRQPIARPAGHYNQALEDDMKKRGQVNPISVKVIPGGYRIRDGQSRVDCAKKLGWTTIKALVQP